MPHRSLFRKPTFLHVCFDLLVPEYEVVSPFQADEKGEFVTHVLHKRSRSKRTTGDQSFLFYSVNAFGLLLHLNVTKAQPILAPGTMVETIHENGSTTIKGAPKNTFYTGHVVSKPGSTAAISNNNGLVCYNVCISELKLKHDERNVDKTASA